MSVCERKGVRVTNLILKAEKGLNAIYLQQFIYKKGSPENVVLNQMLTCKINSKYMISNLKRYKSYVLSV